MKQVNFFLVLLLISTVAHSQTVTPNPGPYQNISTKYQYTWQKWSGGLWNLGKLIQEDSAYFKGITYVPTALDADSNTKAANTEWVRKWVADNVSPGVPGVPASSWATAGNYTPSDPTPYRLGLKDSMPLHFITNSQIRLTIPDNGIKRNYGLANKFLVIDTATKELFYMDGGAGSPSVVSYEKNITRDSTILTLSDGTRFAAKDSVGGGGSGSLDYVVPGFGVKVDSINRTYTVSADTNKLALKDTIKVKMPLYVSGDTLQFNKDSSYLVKNIFLKTGTDSVFKTINGVDSFAFLLGGGGIQSIVAGSNITVDNTDPLNPVVSSTGGGGSDTLKVSVSDTAAMLAPYLNQNTNRAAYTLFGRGAGIGTPSFLSSIDSNWVTGLHSEAYYNTKYAAINGAAWSILGNAATNPTTNFLGTTDAQDLVLRVNNTPRVRLFNSSGNLQVGNFTDQGFKFYTEGTGRFSGELSAWGGGFRLNRNGGDAYFVFHQNGSQVSQIRGRADGKIDIADGGGSTRYLTFSSAGLGIGQATPTSKIHIQGFVSNVQENIRLDINATGDGTFPLMTANTVRYTSSSGDFNNDAGYVNRFYLGTTEVGNYGFLRNGNNTSSDFFIGTAATGTLNKNLVLKNNGSLLIGTLTDNSSSILTLGGTTKGFLLPRMTTTQKNAIASPATALQLYDTDTKQPQFYDGVSWKANVGMIFGTAAPAITPAAVGNFFLDTTNKKLYVSTGTSSSADWNILN